MTDNRTTEQTATNRLRTLLDERGIEYTESQDRFRTRFRFSYCEACCDYLNEIETMGACITASKSYLTPEQAIAVTLGSDNEYEAKMDALLCRLTNGKWSKSCAYSLDFMVSCVDEEYEELYEKERAELGNGTLTAEQVREAIERHSAWVIGNNRCFHDGAYEAIADELNAELGSGTCELAYGEDDEGYDGWYCQSCGGWFDAVRRDGKLVEPRRCGCCGKAVER